MAYTWFCAENLAVDHPKAIDLAADLKVTLAHADGYLFRFWSWIHRFAPTGVFAARMSPQIDAYVCIGEPQKAITQAMRSAGLIDAIPSAPDMLEVHDWYEKQGATLEKSSRDAKMKRKTRRARGAKTARAGRAPGARAARLQGGEDREEKTGQGGHEEIRAGEPRAPDPRHAPMVKALTDRFTHVTGSKYPFTPRDAKSVAQLLTLAIDPTILAAWDRALRHTGFPTVRTLAELVTHFAHFVAPAPVRGRADDATAGEGPITAKEIQL